MSDVSRENDLKVVPCPNCGQAVELQELLFLTGGYRESDSLFISLCSSCAGDIEYEIIDGNIYIDGTVGVADLGIICVPESDRILVTFGHTTLSVLILDDNETS